MQKAIFLGYILRNCDLRHRKILPRRGRKWTIYSKGTMRDTFTYKGIDFELKGQIGEIEIIGGSRRANCRKTFRSADDAKRFIAGAVDRAMRNGRFPLVEGFSGRLEPWC